MSKPIRPVLTKPQTGSEFGARLIATLQSIAADREISLEEVRSLHELLKTGPEDVPAVNFLLSHTSAALLDSVLDDYERYGLKCAIERVLPKAQREGVAQALAGIIDPEDIPKPPPLPKPPQLATPAQLEYIRILGGVAEPTLTKEAASDLITNLRLCVPATSRQIMVLRFWNKTEMSAQGRNAISAWMDQFYTEDPRRKDVWEQFKRSRGDDGCQGDPSWVPVGAGWELLQKSRRSGVGCAVLFLLLAGLVVLCWQVFRYFNAPSP
jgi:hypothetical protein